MIPALRKTHRLQEIHGGGRFLRLHGCTATGGRVHPNGHVWPCRTDPSAFDAENHYGRSLVAPTGQGKDGFKGWC